MPLRNDLELYERHAGSWWDPRSPTFRSLHAAKHYHRELLARQWGPRLDGAHLVDLGSGGGLLSVPFVGRLGALTSVDISPASLDAARSAAGRTDGSGDAGPTRMGFVRADVRATGLASGCADLVTLSDVIEHVDDPDATLAEAARLLRPGGGLFVNTLSKTRRARWIAVYLAEGIGLIPKGTHDPGMFVSPDDLVRRATPFGLADPVVLGESPRFWPTVRHWAIHLRRTNSTALSYSAFFTRV